jgi:hypothetical protein
MRPRISHPHRQLHSVPRTHNTLPSPQKSAGDGSTLPVTARVRWIPEEFQIAWFCKSALSATDDVPKKTDRPVGGQKNLHRVYSDSLIFEKQAIFSRRLTIFRLTNPRQGPRQAITPRFFAFRHAAVRIPSQSPETKRRAPPCDVCPTTCSFFSESRFWRPFLIVLATG